MTAPVKTAISLDTLNQLDIRIGTILSVNDVPDSDKLVQMRVSFGDHERTIVAGIKKERADPREIEGKQALFVINRNRARCEAFCRKGCCSISVTPAALHRCWQCRKSPCQMERGPVRPGRLQPACLGLFPRPWRTSTRRKPRGTGAAGSLHGRRGNPGGKSSCR